MADTAGFGAKLLQRLSPPARKIAVLRASRLGDFICATPALRALRAAAPHAEIAMITLPLLADLVERLPTIDRFIAFPGFPGIAEQFFQARDAVAFLRRMQAERFDLAIQLQGSGVYANPFMLMLGARATAGFIRAEDAPGRLDTALVWPDHLHEIDRLRALMNHLGAPASDAAPDFPLLPRDLQAADELTACLPSPLIGLQTGSHDPLRRWPPARFVSVARTLLHRHGGTVLLFGNAHEASAIEEMVGAIGAGAYSLAGATPLGTLGAVIERLSLLITNDTGPAHIAFAIGTPTVGIYRAGGTRRYGPLLSGPFRALEPPTSDALVSTEAVVDAADELLTTASLLHRGADGCLPDNRPTPFSG